MGIGRTKELEEEAPLRHGLDIQRAEWPRWNSNLVRA